MIASALPATPRGSSRSEDASGFRGLLAALLSPDGEGGAVSPDGPPTQPALLNSKVVDSSAEPLVLPGEVDAKAPEPQVLPGTPPLKDAGPFVLPGVAEAKAAEPQVLPDTAPAKNAEPLVLPGVAEAKEPEPQVLPDSAPAKGAEPLVLPGVVDARTPQPQVLPDATAAKASGPQVLPGATPDKAAHPQIQPGTGAGSDSMEVAPSGPASEATRPGTGQAPTPSHQSPPPPLRALAERTSRPLDESGAAPSSSNGDGKSTGPTTSLLSAPVEPPARGAPQAAASQAAPQAADSPAPAVDEGHSSGGPTTAQAEASAPARDHSLSTLSRASIDATAQIAAQIQRRLEGRSTRFEIALRPAELGRVDVKLDIDSEGRLAARLAFDNPAAATDMRGRVDELRRQLEAAGFHLAEDAFEFADRDSGSSAFDRGQDARHGQNRAFAAAARLKTEIDMAQPPQWLAVSLSPSGVDMKV
jgi:hypothetical protein